MALLERRLDTVVYRAKFVPTVFAARQFVNHGHIRVNGKRVNIASYQLKDNDVVEVREKSRELAVVLEAVGSAERDVPGYIDADHKKMRAVVPARAGAVRCALSGADEPLHGGGVLFALGARFPSHFENGRSL